MDGELIYSLPSLDEVCFSQSEHHDQKEKMQAQHHQQEEHQCIHVCNTLSPMPAHSPDVAVVSDDDSSVDSSPYVEMSESEGRIWPDHPNMVDDYVHDCDSIGPNVVEPDPHPSPPAIASKGDWYNHCHHPFAPYQYCLQC